MNVTKGFAPIDGSKLYYEVAGEGHPLLLVHSMMTSHKLWDDQFGEFAKKYRVIRYDVRGFGQSQMTSAPFSDTQDIKQLLERLNIEKTYILGLSMGAEIAMHFTLDHPAMVDALIMSGAGLDGYDYSAEGMEKWKSFVAIIQERDFSRATERFIDLFVDNPIHPANEVIRQRARILMKDYKFPHFLPPENEPPQAEEASVAAEAPAEYVPAIQKLAEIEVPTLVILGEGENADTLAIGDILSRDIPNAQKVMIPAGHFTSLQNPAAFNQAVLKFLAGLG
jgi:pimeloyl-ACP methyl ester carboxylesterase